MTYDRYRAADFALALMYLTLHDEVRTWKGYSWDVLDHLFQMGLISDPRSKAKSVVLTQEGLARSRALFTEYLAASGPRLPLDELAAHAAPHADATRTGTTFDTQQQVEVVQFLEPFCRPHADPAVRANLRIDYRVEGSAVILFESRPAYQNPLEWVEVPVAKFRYVVSRRVWRLLCMHRDLKWHRYELLPEADSLAELAHEVRRDPSGIFWG